jgi:hypothetical protein
MRTFSLVLLIQIFAFAAMAQSKEVLELEQSKKTLQIKISVFNDSIKKIDSKIEALKANEILSKISDSTLRGFTIKGAKLKKAPDPQGEVSILFDEEKEVVILDYSDLYFGVCSGGICGYMSEIWVKKSPEIENFISAKNFEKEELKRLESERVLRQKSRAIQAEKAKFLELEQAEKAKFLELEKTYIKKYGEKNYSKMKQGYYWIGMNKEMATISIGTPNKVNRTVGAWGVKEQWVYNTIYLYFENGVLTSYQD